MTKIRRNLDKLLALDNTKLNLEAHFIQLQSSLREIQGYGTISTDTALLEEMVRYARENKLQLGDDFYTLYNRTGIWNHAGIINDAHHCEAILESVHHNPAGIYPYQFIVDRLVYLINDADTLNEFARIGVPCSWHKIKSEVKASIEYWLGQGKLSKELVTRAANAVKDTGYDSGLEDWR